MDPIDARLARVQERIARERASGIPAKQPPPPPAEELTREQKQRMWDAICQHEPELAQLIREARAKFGKLDVRTLRLPQAPECDVGPDLKPFNAVQITVHTALGAESRLKNNQRGARA